MARYVITGKCGLISNKLTTHLLDQGHQVHTLDIFEKHRRVFSEPSFSNIDLFNAQLDSEFAHIDGCFHLTNTQSTDSQCDIDHATYFENLFDSTLILNTAARHNVPVVYNSSFSVYGNNIESPLSENDVTKPTTLMGASFLALEQYAKAVSTSNQLPVTGLRLFEVYGDSITTNTLTVNLINQITHNLNHNEKWVIKGALHSVYDFIHINDVVRAFSSAMDNISSPAQIINICSGQTITTPYLIQTLLNMMNLSNSVEFKHVSNAVECLSVGDNRLGRMKLKFEPKINLLDGLGMMIKPLSLSN